MEYEIIKFENDNLELDINVSPEEETIWLNTNQMATLFETSRQNITMHIKKIVNEGEVDNPVSKNFLHTENEFHKKESYVATDGKKYNVDFYNLDMVLAVGYRVKSKRAVEFRKWATSVLKEYLLKGYALNEGRTLITKDNYLNLVNRVDTLNKRVDTIESAEKHRFVEDVLLLDNQMFDAIVLISRMIETAHTSIVLIDPYVDAISLSFFKNKSKELNLVVVTSSKANIGRREISSFNERYGNLEIKIDDKCHDRYLIIDNELFYHLGCSINYIGKRLSQITLIKDKDIVDALKKRMRQYL